ncbi:CPBP family intramembrane metalloprotease [Paramixta manurensis]|uniref:CPBP family intramembrane metalloprotease n=1 Tax=Paramixta manurensis TaxID=2740817 RepID=A0A6M8UH25_9GAMM|nr:CPBP family intramembrane metalloprotease [Erwiniaceae bacterium PD-1]
MNLRTGRVFLTLFYIGSFVLYYLITLMITLFPNYTVLRADGLLVPVLCLFEFAVIYPLYRFYIARRSDIPLGRLAPASALLYSGLLLLLMIAQTWFLQPERWLEDQSQQSLHAILILLFSAVLLAPIFEEILFRGFLLQGFLVWAPKSRFACMLLTSLLFAVMHTQYVHWQTLVILTLFSLLLCAARLRSNSLALPIFLHMLNNLIALLPSLFASTQNG